MCFCVAFWQFHWTGCVSVLLSDSFIQQDVLLSLLLILFVTFKFFPIYFFICFFWYFDLTLFILLNMSHFTLILFVQPCSIVSHFTFTLFVYAMFPSRLNLHFLFSHVKLCHILVLLLSYWPCFPHIYFYTFCSAMLRCVSHVLLI